LDLCFRRSVIIVELRRPEFARPKNSEQFFVFFLNDRFISIHRDRFSCFCMVPKCYACQWGRKSPKFPLPLVYRHPAGGRPSHGHRQHAQKLVKIARVVPEISSRTDRHTHTQTYSSEYFATAPTPPRACNKKHMLTTPACSATV